MALLRELPGRARRAGQAEVWERCCVVGSKVAGRARSRMEGKLERLREMGRSGVEESTTRFEHLDLHLVAPLVHLDGEGLRDVHAEGAAVCARDVCETSQLGSSPQLCNPKSERTFVHACVNRRESRACSREEDPRAATGVGHTPVTPAALGAQDDAMPVMASCSTGLIPPDHPRGPSDPRGVPAVRAAMVPVDGHEQGDKVFVGQGIVLPLALQMALPEASIST